MVQSAGDGPQSDRTEERSIPESLSCEVDRGCRLAQTGEVELMEARLPWRPVQAGRRGQGNVMLQLRGGIAAAAFQGICFERAAVPRAIGSAGHRPRDTLTVLRTRKDGQVTRAGSAWQRRDAQQREYGQTPPAGTPPPVGEWKAAG